MIFVVDTVRTTKHSMLPAAVSTISVRIVYTAAEYSIEEY